MSENIVCTFIDAHFAELVLRVIDEVEYPRLMCDGEKEAVRKGLMLLLDRQPVEGLNNPKPCPFCGGEVEYNELRFGHFIRCPKCRISMGNKNKNDLFENWNKRVGTQ